MNSPTPSPSPAGGPISGESPRARAQDPQLDSFRPASDLPFYLGIFLVSGFYLLLLASLLIADLSFTTPMHLLKALGSPEIQYSLRLSLLTSTLSAVISLWIAVPVGFIMSRYRFPGRRLLDAVLDIPIVFPPLVIGISLLILFQMPPFRHIEKIIPMTYSIPGVILAQVTVACAFAVRTMRVTFDQIDPRREQVALTLGCNKSQAFWLVILPEAKRGLFTAVTIAWARALGEFGPILVFSGATRMKTEVLPTSIFLELSVGNIEAAVAVSLLMVLAAVLVLVVVRRIGEGGANQRSQKPRKAEGMRP